MFSGQLVAFAVHIVGVAALAASAPTNRAALRRVPLPTGATPIEALANAVGVPFHPEADAVLALAAAVDPVPMILAAPIVESGDDGMAAGLNGSAAVLAHDVSRLPENLREGDEAAAHQAAGALFDAGNSAGSQARLESFFVGQGFAVTRPVEFEPLSERHRASIDAAVDVISRAIKQKSPSLSDADRTKAVAIEERLLEIILEHFDSPHAISEFRAPVFGDEDYCLGYSAPRHLRLSAEVLEDLHDQPALLAEYLFHAAWASFEPERNKSDHRDRYLGLQRLIFGAANPLQARLRGLIDSRAPAAAPLGLKGGYRGPHGDSFYEYLNDGLIRHYETSGRTKRIVDIEYTEIAANSLSRMAEASLRKLVTWGVLDKGESDFIRHQDLYAASHPKMVALAAKIQALIGEYEAAAFSPPGEFKE